MKTMKLYLITFAAATGDSFASLHHESRVTDDPAKAAWYYRNYLDGLHALDFTRGSQGRRNDRKGEMDGFGVQDKPSGSGSPPGSTGQNQRRGRRQHRGFPGA